MQNLSIQLSDEIYNQLPNTSELMKKFIEDAINDKFQRVTSSAKDDLLREGYIETYKEDLEVTNSFAKIDFESLK